MRNVKEVIPLPRLEDAVARPVLGQGTFTDQTMTLTEYDINPMRKLSGFYGHEDREEIYYIIEGEGLMKLGPFQRKVGWGDAILIPCRQEHQLVNSSRGLLRMFCLGGRVEVEPPPDLKARHRSAMFVRNASSIKPTTGAEGCDLRVMLREEERLFEGRLLFFTDYTINPERFNVVHAHKDLEEGNFVLTGEGVLREWSEERRIREGDCIYIPQGEEHQFINDSQIPLHFIHFAARVKV